MSYTEKELEEQEAEFRSKLSWIAFPIIIMCAIFIFIKDNSLDYRKRKYLEQKNFSISGSITDKKQEGDYPRAKRTIILNNGNFLNINYDVYNKINIGDSLNKSAGKDSIYYYLQDGKTLIYDYCNYTRNAYLELLKSREEN